MEVPPTSPLVSEALAVASEAHSGHIRNGAGGIPYIEHPVAVAELIAAHGWAEDVIAAALLHDVIEDSGLGPDEIRDRFGEPVTSLVLTLTDDESIGPWEARKAEHRERIAAAEAAAQAIYGADKLTNARALRGAWEDEGAAVEAELKVPLEAKLEAWEADLEMLRQAAPELAYLDELELELTALRELRAAAGPPAGT